MRSTSPVFVAFACVLVGPVVRAQSEPAASLRTVSTSGEASVYVTPDEVVVNLGVETYNVELDQARVENDRRSALLVQAIRGLGVEEKHIQTAELQVEPRYKYREQVEVLEAYFARRSYSVTLKQPKNFERLVETALKNGANRVLSFDFRTTELRKHRDRARLMAIRAAKEKAAALAGELECTVGSPRTITEGSWGYFGYYGGGWRNQNAYMSQNAVQVMPQGGGGEGGETLPLGQIAIRGQVSVTFDLVPKAAGGAGEGRKGE